MLLIYYINHNMKWEVVKIDVEDDKKMISKSSQTNIQIENQNENSNLLTNKKSKKIYKKSKINTLYNYLCPSSIIRITNYKKKTLQIPDKLYINENIRLKSV